MTAYQTDYSMAAVTVRAEGSPLQPPGGEPFNLPLAFIEGQAGTSTPRFTSDDADDDEFNFLMLINCMISVMLLIIADFGEGVATSIPAASHTPAYKRVPYK